MFCPCRGQKQLLNDAVSVTQSLAILCMVSIKICPSFQQGMFYVWIVKRNILKAFGLLVFELKDCWKKIICCWLNILLPTYGSLVFLQFFFLHWVSCAIYAITSGLTELFMKTVLPCMTKELQFAKIRSFRKKLVFLVNWWLLIRVKVF